MTFAPNRLRWGIGAVAILVVLLFAAAYVASVTVSPARSGNAALDVNYFEQTQQNTTIEGRYVLVGDGRKRVEYRNPRVQVLAADGTVLHTFRWETFNHETGPLEFKVTVNATNVSRVRLQTTEVVVTKEGFLEDVTYSITGMRVRENENLSFYDLNKSEYLYERP
jgi:hypothetical protein